MTGELTIGLDLGGTRIKAGVVGAGGEVVLRRVVPVGAAKSSAGVVSLLAEVVRSLREEAPGEVRAVGLAAAGVLDRRRGVIRESPNFPLWRDLDLGRRLEAEAGLPVALENDANAVILGEARAGAGRGARDLVGFTLGTGVGGAVVLGGELWRGARGMAGELGHVTVVPDGRACGCGNRGCLEQYAGAVGIRQTLRQRGGRLAEIAQDDDAPRSAALLAREGDPEARAVFEDVGIHLGLVVAALVHALDVTRVVVAGGIAHASDLFLDAAIASFRARAFRSMSEGVEIVPGSLGEDAGVVGAALAVASPDPTD